ncbi:unnamed protein product [Closterium sp. NIES-54]
MDSSFSIKCHGSFTVPCPAFPSGTVTRICAPTFRYNLLAQREIQHAEVITINPNDVNFCDAKTGIHLARFTLNSNNLYTLIVPPIQTCSLTHLPLPSSGSTCHYRLLFDKTMLFHHLLGHINFHSLSDLATKQLLHGFPASFPSPTSNLGPPCLDYAQSKLCEQPHPLTESISIAPLDRVHMDLWGPAPVRSHGRHFYFLVIIDDYSRYVFVHLLASKSEAPAIIIEWAKQAHNHFKTTIKGYAMLHAAALHNLHPHPHHTHTTPAELWTGQKPSVRPLRVWGCAFYVLFDSQARRATGGKLAPKTIMCVYLGHNSDSPDYLFLHPSTTKLYRSRDVFLDESHPFYPSSKASPSPPLSSLTWADFDNLSPSDTPSSPLPAHSTVSDLPPPTSPSSTTQSPPLLPSPSPPPLAPLPSSPPALPTNPASALLSEPPPVKTYHRRPPAPAPAPDPTLDPTPTSPAATPPAPPPSPIASRTHSHKAPKPLSLSVRVSLNPLPVGSDYSLLPSLLEDRHEKLIDVDSAIHALCFLFPYIGDSPTLNFSDSPSIPTPLTYAEAVSGPHAAQWLGAIVVECEAFIHTRNFTDVSPPSGFNIVKGK